MRCLEHARWCGRRRRPEGKLVESGAVTGSRRQLPKQVARRRERPELLGLITNDPVRR
jgi:hypothetical protein